jgi:hypothetical protein
MNEEFLNSIYTFSNAYIKTLKKGHYFSIPIRGTPTETIDFSRSKCTNCNTPKNIHLKRQCHEIVYFRFYFMNQFPPSPRVSHLDRFKFFRKFAAIFAAQGAPPMSLTTPVANGKNLQSENVYILFLNTFER